MFSSVLKLIGQRGAAQRQIGVQMLPKDFGDVLACVVSRWASVQIAMSLSLGAEPSIGAVSLGL